MTMIETHPTLWGATDGGRRGRNQDWPSGPRCALCTAVPASEFGLCAAHLAAAAAEHARLAAPPAGAVPDPRPSSVPFGSLCRRCGSCRHDTSECVA
jgi:hypothetical protein